MSFFQRNIAPKIKGSTDFMNFDIDVREEDLEDFMSGNKSSQDKLLGAYSVADMKKSFEDRGIMQHLREMGFSNPRFLLKLNDPFVHQVVVTHDSLNGLPDDKSYLINLLIRRRDYRATDFQTFVDPHNVYNSAEVKDALKAAFPSVLKITVIEWLSMQNPLHPFQPNRPQLPGQRFPGLGIGREFMENIVESATKNGRDALLNVPERFHNAVLYHYKGAKFVNPAYEGHFMALLEDLEQDIAHYGLAAVAWAIEWGYLHSQKEPNRAFVWKADDQLTALTSVITNWFDSRAYKQIVEQYKKLEHESKWTIDWNQAREAIPFRVQNV